LGIGDWGLGIGDWAEYPIPKYFEETNSLKEYKIKYYILGYDI